MEDLRVLGGISSRPWRLKISLLCVGKYQKAFNRKERKAPREVRRENQPVVGRRVSALGRRLWHLGVECLHDSPGPSRNSGLPGLQEAAGAERKWREPEVRRVQAGLSSARRHSDSAGGRGHDGRVRTSLVVRRWPLAKPENAADHRILVAPKNLTTLNTGRYAVTPTRSRVIVFATSSGARGQRPTTNDRRLRRSPSQIEPPFRVPQ